MISCNDSRYYIHRKIVIRKCSSVFLIKYIGQEAVSSDFILAMTSLCFSFLFYDFKSSAILLSGHGVDLYITDVGTNMTESV